jgi:hypothetical protein
VGVHEESEDELQWMRGLLQLRCWIQIMTCMKITKFPSRSQDGFELVQAPPDESVFVLAVFKKQAAHAFLGCKILSTVYNWRAVG